MKPDLEGFLKNLQHSRKTEILILFDKICTYFPHLEPELKWNAPSFLINGVNVVTFRLFPDPHLQIVLHNGSKRPEGFLDLRFAVANLKHRWADSSRCVIDVRGEDSWHDIQRALMTWLARVSN